TRRLTLVALGFVTYFFVLGLAAKRTVILYLPFFSFGSRAVTLPFFEALSLTFTDFLPYFTVTVPLGRARPAALTRTVTLARLPTLTFLTFAVTFAFAFATAL